MAIFQRLRKASKPYCNQLYGITQTFSSCAQSLTVFKSMVYTFSIKSFHELIFKLGNIAISINCLVRDALQTQNAWLCRCREGLLDQRPESTQRTHCCHAPPAAQPSSLLAAVEQIIVLDLTTSSRSSAIGPAQPVLRQERPLFKKVDAVKAINGFSISEPLLVRRQRLLPKLNGRTPALNQG